MDVDEQKSSDSLSVPLENNDHSTHEPGPPGEVPTSHVMFRNPCILIFDSLRTVSRSKTVAHLRE